MYYRERPPPPAAPAALFFHRTKGFLVQFFEQIAKELSIAPGQAKAVAELLDEGATIPFIARYRKEAHGSLDEVAVAAVRDRLTQLRELEARRQAVLASLAERELLTDELRASVMAAETMTALEDVYLPYRPKRRTRATMAREKGLEPLALALLEQAANLLPEQAAKPFVDAEKGVESVEVALAGARDIIAEIASEHAAARASMREYFARKAVAASSVAKGKEEEGAKFRDYFDWQENAAKAAGHRLLAMLRGEAEGILTLRFLPEAEPAQALFRGVFVKNSSPAGQQVREAVDDGYKRLLAPSLETELRATLRKKAESEAIAVFARNLRQLLLASPLGQKRVLAIDPGFRTGCKIVCLDAQGTLLHHDLIHILSEGQRKDAGEKVRKLAADYGAEAIAIGNGTAGRETETLVRSLHLSLPVLVVSESGASVYSASETARREFPDLDLTVRGAVSIGRRLMDPLAELVKIDPKAIGVGQYQHDVDQTDLKKSLDDVVESCVNAVGVEVNTASMELLTHVSGLGPALAKSVVTYREANGPFAQRKDLKKVPRLGPKAFEQAAGFLRIHGGANPLDASAVHPESYGIVKAMAADLGCSVPDLLANAEMRRRIKPEAYVTETVGLPTLRDILAELEKPGRDPREAFEAFAFAEDVTRIEDLEAGMRLPGIVTNVTNFGAFVDIGVHQDGLVHISQLADSFVSDPHTVVTVQQQVSVTVLEVDAARKRISLSMRKNPDAAPARGQARDQTRDQARDQAREPNAARTQPVRENRPRPKTENRPRADNRQDRQKPEQGHRPFQDMLAKFGKR
ncbi:MAG: RNA-binding transcriptional accessory protein [Desulfovibrio sp. MES5]|uniref:Tex family protein n=1 Tax=Desulfovibrio sp. MES5 TaxID=1899016 RepID=UPI000B9CD939|nr:Tex family protein [Desulfovibrio sp. MES5]OXS28660.1 MAG: RNA-binding transcriptional accessory protein [Desulfovibrio sp. MES5]